MPDDNTLSTTDVIEITALVSRLCQAFDFSRPGDVVDCFVPDGVFRMVSTPAAGEVEQYRHTGTTELRAFAEAMVERRQGNWRHWTGNLVVDGDARQATAVSYVLFVQIDPETKERRIPVSGVHRDAFQRTANGWRFTSRTVVPDA